MLAERRRSSCFLAQCKSSCNKNTFGWLQIGLDTNLTVAMLPFPFLPLGKRCLPNVVDRLASWRNVRVVVIRIHSAGFRSDSILISQLRCCLSHSFHLANDACRTSSIVLLPGAM